MASFESLLIGLTFGAFSYFLLLFQWIGFFNFSLKIHPFKGISIGEHRWSASIWCIVQLAFAVISAILIKRHYNHLFYGLLLTDTMNNYMKCIIGLVTIFVSLGDSWFEVETHRSIWMHYRTLATRTGTMLGLVGRGDLARVLAHYMISFLGMFIVCVVFERIIYGKLPDGSQWHWFWLHNLYPNSFSHFRHVFHMLHITLMVANLRQLRCKLVELQRTGALERLEECRAIYCELWQINEGINELFGFSQACNIACSFAQMAFDLYWLYTMWQKHDDRMNVQIFCIVPTPVIMGFFMHTARRHQLEMDALEETVLNITLTQDAETMKERFYFLHQLLDKRIRLTARDIFDFDYTLIRKLVIVILTYVIIFIEISD